MTLIPGLNSRSIALSMVACSTPDFSNATGTSRARIDVPSKAIPLVRIILSPTLASAVCTTRFFSTSPRRAPTAIGLDSPWVISECPPIREIPNSSQASTIWSNVEFTACSPVPSGNNNVVISQRGVAPITAKSLALTWTRYQPIKSVANVIGSVFATRNFSPISMSAASSPRRGPKTTCGSENLICLSSLDSRLFGSLPACTSFIASSVKYQTKGDTWQCYHKEVVIRAIFFDMYNTLARFEPTRFEIQSQACSKFGIKLSEEGIVRGYAAADIYMTEQNMLNPIRLRSQAGKDLFFAEYERLVLSGCGVDLTPEQALSIWTSVKLTPHKLQTFEDVEPTLLKLKDIGLKLGMISNIDQLGEELALGLRLNNYLDISVTSKDLGVEKPDPKVFQIALRKISVNPDEAIHVGDQISSDVEGALATGIYPVLLDRDRNNVGYSCCSRIEGLSELPDLICDL